MADRPDDFTLVEPVPRRARPWPASSRRFGETFPRLWPQWLGPCPEAAIVVELRERKWPWTAWVRFALLGVGAALVASLLRERSWGTGQWLACYAASVVIALYGVANVGQWLDLWLSREWVVFTPRRLFFASRTFDPEARPRFRYWANDVERGAVRRVAAVPSPAGEAFVGGPERAVRRYVYWRLRLWVRGPANPFAMDTDTTAEERKHSTQTLIDLRRLKEAARAAGEPWAAGSPPATGVPADAPAPATGGGPADGAADETGSGDDLLEIDLGEIGATCARWTAAQIAAWAGVPVAAEDEDGARPC